MSHHAELNPWGREIVRETHSTTTRPRSTGRWIAAVVAVVALVGLIFLFNNQNRADEAQAVREAADAQGAVADQTAQAAADQTARQVQIAADEAQGASAAPA
jgi:hypothetical protein